MNGTTSALSRILRIATPVLAVATLAPVARYVLATPDSVWNDIRLAPAAALLSGYWTSGGAGGGPSLINLYGPTSTFYYVPAALLPTPTAAILAASLMSLLIVVGPVAWMLWREAGGRWRAATLPLLLFVLYSARSDVLRVVLFNVHADAPALGLGALACALIYGPADRRRPVQLVLCGIVVVLAVAAKQPILPLVLAVPVFLWLTMARGPATRAMLIFALPVLAALMVAMLSGSSLQGGTTDATAVIQEMSWKHGHLGAALVHALRDLVPRWAPFGAALGLYAAARWPRKTEALWQREWLAENAWVLPLLVSVACLPTSLLGRAIDGAAMNGLAYSQYFVVVAAALVATRILAAGPDRPEAAMAPSLRVAAIITIAAVLPLAAGDAIRVPALVRALPSGPETIAFRFAQSHPGEAYFPHRPLVGLKADGQLYHVLLPATTRVVLSRIEGQERASYVRRHLPANLRWILYHGQLHPQQIERFEELRREILPGFRSRTRLPEMPGWIALEEASPSAR